MTVALAQVLTPGPASAKLCGDNVAGVDVPCECGDIVASSVRLDDDPVVAAACPRNGLIVRPRDVAGGVDIDLNGRTLTGSGEGAGLWILDAETAGARVTSSGGPATIEGFRDGILAKGPRSVAEIRGVVLKANVNDGVHLYDVNGTQIHNVEALDSGRHGFSVIGKEYLLTATRAVRSGHHGYNLSGMNATLGSPGAGNVAEGSGRIGIEAMGSGFRFVECVAIGSGNDGLWLQGNHVEVTDCRAVSNGGDGFVGRAMDWRVAGNQANDNANNGLVIMGSGIVDGGGNSGTGNRGSRAQSTAKQCEIGGQPCGL
jgi:hypothetical protein